MLTKKSISGQPLNYYMAGKKKSFPWSQIISPLELLQKADFRGLRIIT